VTRPGEPAFGRPGEFGSSEASLMVAPPHTEKRRAGSGESAERHAVPPEFQPLITILMIITQDPGVGQFAARLDDTPSC